MVLIAIGTTLGFATIALIITLNRRQIRCLKCRLDTQAKTMIILAGLIRDGEETEDPVIPPAKPERHLHVVRDSSAFMALALLLRRTRRGVRSHPALAAAAVALTTAAAAAMLTLPGTSRRPGTFRAGPTATSIPTAGSTSATPNTGPSASPKSPAPHTPQGTTTTRTGTAPPTPPTTTPFGPPSDMAGPDTPQPISTAPYPPATSSTSPTSRTPAPVSSPAGTPSSPACALALDIRDLIELRLLCP